jgi:cytochrome P450
VHHRFDVYPEPERFDPDRWADGAIGPPRAGFIPFGLGARKCIGEQFGYLEVILSLASIAAQWRLRPVSSKPVRTNIGVLISPRRLRLRLEARNAAAPRKPSEGRPWPT